MWSVLNHKLFNTVIILLVIIEGLVIFAELLLDLDIIQDPNNAVNCSLVITNNSVVPFKSVGDNHSEGHGILKLILSRRILSQVSLIIVTIFVSEVLLRIFCGKSKYLVQPFELLDSLLVFVVFIMDLIFYLRESDSTEGLEAAQKHSGQEAALLIVILRLWRIHKVIQSIAEDAQAKVLSLLVVCEKEKNHAEHKVDILILKVEDLEHEVAYLKEKAKKSDKESAAALHQISLVYKKKQPVSKRTSSSNLSNSSGSISFCPCQKAGAPLHPLGRGQLEFDETSSIGHLSNSNSVQQHVLSSVTSPSVASFTITNGLDKLQSKEISSSSSPTVLTSVDLNIFALKLAQSITSDVVSVLLNSSGRYSRGSANQRQGAELARAPGHHHHHRPHQQAARFVRKSANNEMQTALSSPDLVSEINPLFEARNNKVLNETSPSTLALVGKENGNSTIISPAVDVVGYVSSLQGPLSEEMEIERIRRLDYSHDDETDIPLTSL